MGCWKEDVDEAREMGAEEGCVGSLGVEVRWGRGGRGCGVHCLPSISADNLSL
jgi:hypothetical protein